MAKTKIMSVRTLSIAALTSAVTVSVLGVSQVMGDNGNAETPAPPGSHALPPRAADSQPTSHLPRIVDGQRWQLTTYRAIDGRLCVGELVPGEGQAMSCFDTTKLYVESPIRVYVGARQISSETTDRSKWDNIFLWGFARADIARLELTLTDCQRVPLTIDDERLFFFVAPRGAVHADIWPAELIGYDASGHVVAENRIDLGVPSTTEAAQAGARRPGFACQ